MQTYKQAAGAGARLKFATPGTFFRLLLTSAPVDVVFFRNGSEVARAEEMEAGYSEDIAAGFDAMEIYSATAQTIKWATRQGGRIAYDRLVGSVQIANNAGPFSSAQKTVTNASAELLAANAARRYLIVQNKDAAGNIYLAFGVAATVANGIKIAPGGSYELAGYVPTNALFAIGDLASNANVATVEG